MEWGIHSCGRHTIMMGDPRNDAVNQCFHCLPRGVRFALIIGLGLCPHRFIIKLSLDIILRPVQRKDSQNPYTFRKL